MPENALQQLSSLYGITLEDSRSKPGQTGSDDRQLISILRAIGLQLVDEQDAGHILRQEKERQRRQILKPVMVLQETTEPLHIPIRLEERDEQTYQWVLRKESGEQLQGRFHLNDLVAVTSGKNIDPGDAAYRSDHGARTDPPLLQAPARRANPGHLRSRHRSPDLDRHPPETPRFSR